MPKTCRKMNPLAGEMSLSGTGKNSPSSSGSPLLPELSIQMSPQHTEESNEVAQINAASNHIFPLSSALEENQGPGFITTAVLSPESLLSQNSNSNPEKNCAFSPQCKRNLNGDVITPKENTLLLGEDAMDTSDEGFRSMKFSSTDISLKGSSAVKVSGNSTRRDNLSTELDISRKEGQTEPNAELENNRKKSSSEVKLEVSLQTEGSQTDREAACALTGFVTLTDRNGDSTMHGVLPSVLSHGQGTALNSCFPGSDGNWYQIISASVPSVTNQHLPENNSSSGKQTPVTTASISNTTTCGGNSALHYLSSLPLTAMAATTTTFSSHGAPITTPVTTADPVMGFITTGPAYGPDNQTPLPALHLPLGLPAGGAVPHTPRYIYATNPRTGQLLILSSVGELAGAQALQQQQLHLQQQQVMQIQQQQLQNQEKTGWKSPLGTSQRQNTLSSAANGLAGKQAAKPGSLINQLLQNKLPSSMALGRATQDENMPPVAAARELLALASPARTRPLGQGSSLPPLFHSSPDLPGDEPVRENHNMKERRRRARIKDACDLMRQLVPGMSEKTDKATVFEFSARYIHFLKNFVGTHHDKDFLIKYSPY